MTGWKESEGKREKEEGGGGNLWRDRRRKGQRRRKGKRKGSIQRVEDRETNTTIETKPNKEQ